MHGSEYQEGGYCALITVFFIHILYNNIVIHNRDIFEKIEDISIIVKYIEDLMVFVDSLINTSPFTNKHFFYNYSINIFRFMLTQKNFNKFYDVYDLKKTKDKVNEEFAFNPHKRDWFLPVESGNVMTIFMNIIFEGMQCLPSLIGVPKLSNKSNYKEMLMNKDYSCIRFFTPYRNTAKICNQPLRLFFENDTEQVEFASKDSNDIYIVDRKKPNYNTRNDDTIIQNPYIVLLNLSKVTYYAGPGRYRDWLTDFSIMEPLPVTNFTSTCLNMTNPHAHIMDTTPENSTKKRKIVIDDDDSEVEDANSNTKYSKQDVDIDYERITYKRNDMNRLRKRNSNRKESKNCVVS